MPCTREKKSDRHGWGWHGPWDSEYWDELGYWPDESYK